MIAQGANCLLIIVLAIGQGDVAKRLPLNRGEALVLPKVLAEEYDEATRKIVKFDAEYTTREINRDAGLVEIGWRVRSGERGSFVYQRLDGIAVTVEVSVIRLSSGTYRYTYRLVNSATSRLPLTGFVVQNFAPDASAVRDPFVAVPRMASDVTGFNQGNWLLFGSSYFSDPVPPGSERLAVIESVSPPGVVGCKAYGGKIFARYPEGTPMPVQDAIGRQYYDLWCRGITLGPSASVGRMRAGERRSYVLDQLPRMRAAGWITSQAEAWYIENLGRTKELLSRRLRADLAAGQITSEFAAVVGLDP